MPAPPLSLRTHRFAQYPLFVLFLFCRAPTSPHTSHVSTFCRLYSSWQCRGAHFPALSFHVEQRLCRPPKPQRLSGFLIVCAYLFIVFSLSFNRLSLLVAVSLCSVLFRHRLFLLPQRTDLSLRRPLCIFSCNHRPPFIAFAVGAPSSPFALNSSIDLLFALTADAFCLRRIFADPPRDRRSLFRLCLLV